MWYRFWWLGLVLYIVMTFLQDSSCFVYCHDIFTTLINDHGRRLLLKYYLVRYKALLIFFKNYLKVFLKMY
jgi:hypothetical protein